MKQLRIYTLTDKNTDIIKMKAVHHPKMIGHITVNAEPVYGEPANTSLLYATSKHQR